MNRKERRIAEKQGKHTTLQKGADAKEIFANALSLQQTGKIKESEYLLHKLLETHPGNAAVLNVLGTIQVQKGNLQKAAELLERAIVCNPNYSKAYNNYGTVLNELKRDDEALTNFDKAITLDPNYVDAHYNRGVTLYALKRLDEALLSYDRAIALNPNYSKPYHNRGVLLFDLKRYAEATESYDKVIELDEKFADAYVGKAWISLLLGDLEKGWKLYEWRFQQSDTPTVVRSFDQPVWGGEESLDGKTILIHAEQGLGDTIQFCRYLPMLERRGANIILIAPEILRNLLLTLTCSFHLVTESQPIPPFDYQCPLMSLPRAFNTTLNTIPQTIPYLFATSEKSKKWHEKLGIKTKPRIGLVWSGGTTHKNDHNRSINIKELSFVLNHNAEFHCLQKEMREGDVYFMEKNNIISHSNELDDFTDTAALIMEMDLVISVDTSVAHLAGALGKPLWILLPFVPDFRWMLNREDSPWYPTAKLFRQPEAGNWTIVIDQLKSELIGLKILKD